MFLLGEFFILQRVVSFSENSCSPKSAQIQARPRVSVFQKASQNCPDSAHNSDGNNCVAVVELLQCVRHLPAILSKPISTKHFLLFPLATLLDRCYPYHHLSSTEEKYEIPPG